MLWDNVITPHNKHVGAFGTSAMKKGKKVRVDTVLTGFSELEDLLLLLAGLRLRVDLDALLAQLGLLLIRQPLLELRLGDGRTARTRAPHLNVSAGLCMSAQCVCGQWLAICHAPLSTSPLGLYVCMFMCSI